MSIPSPLPASSIRHSLSSFRSTTSSQASFGESIVEDILAPGDIIGPGLPLQGYLIHPTSTSTRLHDNSPDITPEFEVIHKLGAGSYAVVYLVREVLSRITPSEYSHHGTLDPGDIPNNSYVSYGREFALKCLSKAKLDEDALTVQLSECTIHQSLRPHPNIVTLYRTFETPAFLLLLLEYVPGEDLFFFLEQARDHYDLAPLAGDSVPSAIPLPDDLLPPAIPPTPSLLASRHSTQLLSPTRLRLIARMFTQMCEAVAVCHEQGVFHRDIKPENFIVTEGFVNGERRVVVKLTDFGLSTTDEDSPDMDCGSTPYMSFECRNNFAPTYKPAAADIWSLGIVLINMLYHCNPWTDTAEGCCPSFTLFMHQGAHFFMDRFIGMTSTVADFLASHAFTLPSLLLPSSSPPLPPVTAREFAEWVKDLPVHFDVLPGSTLGLGVPQDSDSQSWLDLPATEPPTGLQQYKDQLSDPIHAGDLQSDFFTLPPHPKRAAIPAAQTPDSRPWERHRFSWLFRRRIRPQEVQVKKRNTSEYALPARGKNPLVVATWEMSKQQQRQNNRTALRQTSDTSSANSEEDSSSIASGSHRFCCFSGL
ncbi:kinase-like domain-containing protein [Scleroderma citrinum]